MSKEVLPPEPYDLTILDAKGTLRKPKPKPQPSPDPDDEDEEEDEDEPTPYLRKGGGESFKLTSPFFSIELQSQQVPITYLSAIAGEWSHKFVKVYKKKKRVGYV